MRLSIEEEKTSPAATPQETDGAPSRELINENLTKEERKRLQKKRLEAMTGKERLLWFADYYKWPVLAIAAAILVVFSIVHEITSRLPDGFNAEMINALVYDTGDFSERFAAYAGIDLTKENCTINMADTLDMGGSDQNSVFTIEKLTVRIAAAEIDIFAADEKTFHNYAKDGTCEDLRTILSAEELALLKDQLVEETIETEEGTSISIPCGIRLDDASALNALNAYPDGDGIVGVVVNSKQKERAAAFLRFIFSLESV